MIVRGLHVLAEIHDCDEKLLTDLQQLEALVKDAAGENGLTVEDSIFHQFSQDGISGVVISPQANLSIHTWPAGRKVTVDMVTSREDLSPLPSCESLVIKFKASYMTAKSQTREIDIGAVALAV